MLLRAPLSAALRRSAFSAGRFQSHLIRKERPPANFGVVIVPQQKAFVVERFGKFHRKLDPGLHFLIPIVDQVAYVHSLKEDAITIASQTAVTRDNVVLSIDGVLYVRIVDPEKASYGVADVHYALTQLAQTTMRSELGKLKLDNTFQERDTLNTQIVKQINAAALNWGAEVLRYEIKDIEPPASVRAAMEMEAAAERRKRAQILESEGNRDAKVNNADGLKRSAVLEAQGEADAAVLRAQATALAIKTVGAAVATSGGAHAVSLRLAEQYIAAFGNIAKTGNTLVLPANAGDAAGMVAQALSVYAAVQKGGAGGATGAVAAAAPAFQTDSDDYADELAGAEAGGHDSEEPFVPADFSRVGSSSPAPVATVSAPSVSASATENAAFKPKPF